jgi:hypothetical protein
MREAGKKRRKNGWEKGLFEAGFSARSEQKGRRLGQKPNFPGDFQGPNLTMRENLGSKSFQQALIPNGLEIICKDSGEIYTPRG